MLALPLAVPFSPSKLFVVGHLTLDGPSVYLNPRSSSKTPESGAVSSIGPSSLVGTVVPPPDHNFDKSVSINISTTG